MAADFHCTIITPVEKVFDQGVTYASFPAWDGQQGVIAGQSPLVSELGIGALRLDFCEGGSRWYLLEGGFAQVEDGTLTLLTDRATPAESLELEQTEAELAEANARVLAPGGDRAAIERDQQRALAKRALARAAAARGGWRKTASPGAMRRGFPPAASGGHVLSRRRC
jgi:F-type H+-transporting ATPase subunit epsilon